MRKVTMSFGASISYKPPHPERTARRSLASWDVTYQEWSNRAALAKSIRMQEKREAHYSDWRPCVALTPGEGH